MARKIVPMSYRGLTTVSHKATCDSIFQEIPRSSHGMTQPFFNVRTIVGQATV
ncbi:hypothetical protein [Rickettsia endosymbiont of Ceutorhynchus obstrictus]|uniref:hypothetical protein n=1 Tax=Rickettsia endosymbiont of Ceutorhynchus obstrictus TaxID=3066249 RepID=UPI0031331B09